MILVSDVHAAFSALTKVVDLGETLVVLGDLANLTDYRTGEGAVSDVMGIEFARAASSSRATGDYGAMRALWAGKVGERRDEVRSQIGQALSEQYNGSASALAGGTGYVIHGNVDRPGPLAESLPSGFEYVHGRAVDVDGLRFGFVGGGVRTPLRADGEVADEEMASLLDSLGPVDVLCSHVPPDVQSLRGDVITGRQERGSGPIRDYVHTHQPEFHFFGDVHQPKATRWRLGKTQCFNAGYFRATGRYLQFDGTMVRIGRVG